MKISLGNKVKINVHEEGHIYLLVSTIITCLSCAFFGFNGSTVFFAFVTLSLVLFFRDPDRVIPRKEGIVVSPADGIVVGIDDVLVENYVKISIFLNLLNVHINRIPISGKIIDIKYNPGKFLHASLDKASSDNEKNTISIETLSGDIINCTQIAGLIARRIVCDAHIGDVCSVGDKYGIIKFSSRVDLYIPKKYKLCISVGQTVIGGETIVAEYN